MSRNRVILLVEDNPDDVDLTLRAFAKSKLANQIVVARDGEEALDYLAPRDTGGGEAKLLPEMMLLDLNLPKVDGLEVLRRVRADARTRRLPVIILSSSAETVDIVSSYDLGANSFVRKPVDFSEFVAAVRQLGLYWMVLNHMPPMD